MVEVTVRVNMVVKMVEMAKVMDGGLVVMWIMVMVILMIVVMVVVMVVLLD